MQDTAQMSETACKTWLLPTGSIHVAIGEFELVHIIAGWQRYIPVPRSPVWCHHVFLWQGCLLPLFDLENYINFAQGKVETSYSSTSDIVGIIAYENQRGEIQYGGLKLNAPPVIRVVSDDKMCDYPMSYPDWNKIALSCFKDPDIGPVPILDIQRIFCAKSQATATTTNSADKQP
jgi:chemotaxis signal transduction protein